MRRTVLARPHRLRRALAPVAVLALVTTLAAGCGDDGDSDSDDGGGDESSAALDDDQLETALLQLDNLGEGWAEGEVSDDDTDSPGCLGDVPDLDDLDPAGKVEASYDYGEQGVPSVDSGTAVFEDQDALEDHFADTLESLTDCTSVDETDDNGTEYSLTLSSDDLTSSDAVDQQINIRAEGTLTTAEGQTATLSLHSSLFRVGPTVGNVATVNIQGSAGTLHRAYTTIAGDRLAAVLAGDEPAETTGPSPL